MQTELCTVHKATVSDYFTRIASIILLHFSTLMYQRWYIF